LYGWLAGTRRTLIKRLTRARRRRTQRNAGAGRCGTGHGRRGHRLTAGCPIRLRMAMACLTKTGLSRLRRTRLMSDAGGKVGAWRNDRPCRWLAHNSGAGCAGAGRTVAGLAEILLTRRRARRGRRLGPGLAGTSRLARRWRDRYAGAHALVRGRR